MTNEKLLAVLDMSEKEQRKWLLINYFHQRMPGVSNADLAFRLRDEVDFNLYLEALEIIYHLWQKRGSVEEQMENNLITFTCWLAIYITAIDRIIAALIAKGEK
jgi:hypothetical protein